MSTQKNLIVNIYKEGSQFRAKVAWFNDKDDPSKPMATQNRFEKSDRKFEATKINWDGYFKKPNV